MTTTTTPHTGQQQAPSADLSLVPAALVETVCRAVAGVTAQKSVTLPLRFRCFQDVPELIRGPAHREWPLQVYTSSKRT